MTAFEAGFIKEASVYGLSSSQAAHILKRAMDYDDGSNQIFKSLTIPQEDYRPRKEEAVEEENPEDLAALAEMLRQDLIDKHLSAQKHKIQF